MIQKQYTSFLYLENGQIYQGWSFVSFFRSVGEVVFNTGMTGYQEIITDPSYYNQIVLFTYPEIGNTGVNIFDIESDRPCVQGIIAKNICLKSSNWRSNKSLVNYLINNSIPHIFGIDTRKLTKVLRTKGVMQGCLSTQLLSNDVKHQLFTSITSKHFIDNVTTKKIYRWRPACLHQCMYFFDQEIYLGTNDLNVIVIDYGVKFNILNRLTYYGCNIIIVPADTNYMTIMDLKPDGVLLSNGPGDPSLISHSVIKNIVKLLHFNIPIFGICLGHQLLSIVMGARTHKLKFGHRGLNHPSGWFNTVKMTSQNHGYVVSMDTISNDFMNISYLNFNDKTVSGIVHKYKPCFSVQYHPEASPGPHDSDQLFSHFVKIMLMCRDYNILST